MFKDGGPFSYFFEPPKPENLTKGNEKMFLTHPAVYLLRASIEDSYMGFNSVVLS